MRKEVRNECSFFKQYDIPDLQWQDCYLHTQNSYVMFWLEQVFAVLLIISIVARIIDIKKTFF